jgi:Protein of unknown function (DUF3617)
MRQLLCIMLAATFGIAIDATAQMKPGLWEFNIRMQSQSAEMDKARSEMQKQLAALPPEQRKMIEEATAGRGMNVGGSAPANTVTQACITKEMAERNEVPSQAGDCKTTTSPRLGNTVKIAFTCPNPPMTGEGELTFVSPEAFTMKMRVTNSARGPSEASSMEQTGRWLAADCGSVKPIAAPAK